ncbi:MAG: DUF1540 domain-containing protein [Defluviitaleaceae bacterium]|nr:DUF1540 domain-containing protein [Defluviitaleaceae bacterium]
MPSQQIRCNVGSCKFNSAAYCSLSSIEVGNTVPNAQTMHQTECASFQAQ